MQHVYTGRDEMDAHFVRGLLEQEGIRAVVHGETLGSGAFGTLPLSAKSSPAVWVDDADVDRAAPIVEEYRRVDRANADDDEDEDGNKSASAQRATWTCPNCGERVETQFTQCWKCGHARPTPGGATTV